MIDKAENRDRGRKSSNAGTVDRQLAETQSENSLVGCVLFVCLNTEGTCKAKFTLKVKFNLEIAQLAIPQLAPTPLKQ